VYRDWLLPANGNDVEAQMSNTVIVIGLESIVLCDDGGAILSTATYESDGKRVLVQSYMRPAVALEIDWERIKRDKVKIIDNRYHLPELGML
jgi:hypothetical protein